MICYLAASPNLRAMRRFAESTSGRLRDELVPMAYEEFFANLDALATWLRPDEMWSPLRLHLRSKQVSLPTGAYIFADLDQLTPEEARKAAAAWDALAGVERTRLLNHPTRAMSRYELLRTLYERRQNYFDVYRLTEARWPRRYPVLLRHASSHVAPETDLLASREELEAELDAIEPCAYREDIVIIEFCDTADASGVYRKYSAFSIGDRVIPKHLYFSSDWVVKDPDILTQAALDEEAAYLTENPHADLLRDLFRLARIDYGRVDYAMLDGEMQVWEINTNPMVAFASDPARVERSGLVREVFERALLDLLAR